MAFPYASEIHRVVRRANIHSLVWPRCRRPAPCGPSCPRMPAIACIYRLDYAVLFPCLAGSCGAEAGHQHFVTRGIEQPLINGPTPMSNVERIIRLKTVLARTGLSHPLSQDRGGQLPPAGADQRPWRGLARIRRQSLDRRPANLSGGGRRAALSGCKIGLLCLYRLDYSPGWLRPPGARRAKARRCSFS